MLSCCAQGFNLEKDSQIFCRTCDRYYHLHHLQELEADDKDREPLVIRGEGWRDIILELTDFQEGDFEQWLWVGSRVLQMGQDERESNAETVVGYTSKAEAMKELQKCEEVVGSIASVKMWKCNNCENIL